ncbi:MAG: hypothetical protein Q9217_004244 [Psora testacea]
MATTSATPRPQLAKEDGGVALPPSPEKIEAKFGLAIALVLHTWVALTIAVQNSWGGANASEKRDWFAGQILELMAETPDTDVEYLEEFLIGVMNDNFDVHVDDGSAEEIAAKILGLRKLTLQGDFTLVDEMYDKWQERQSKGGDAKVNVKHVEGIEDEQDTDFDSDDVDEEEDVEMDQAPSLIKTPKEKVQPKIDEDGFTKVDAGADPTSFYAIIWALFLSPVYGFTALVERFFRATVRMTQDNRYPSPEPTNVTHPYHNSQQQMASDQSEHLQQAPTAMMHDQGADGSGIAQSLQYIAQYGPPQSSTSQQLAQQGLDIDGQNSDPSAKKKTKVSRACDECRRKKVWLGLVTVVVVVLAKRSSRQPQKRGPSKGYIKELAERVSRLEYPGATPPDIPYTPITNGLPLAEQQAYASHMNFDSPNQRKRTHSMVDGSQSYMQGEDQLQEFARGSAQTPDMVYSGANNALLQAPIYDLPSLTRGAVTGLSPDDLERYYSRIHTTLPLLPESHFELQSILDRAPLIVREAFKAALGMAVKAGQTAVSETQERSAAALCLAVKMTRSNDLSMTQHLVHMQTLLLMAIADELNGPSSSQNANWLGFAVLLANSLHLQKVQYMDHTKSSDVDRLIRRAWLSLVILDRWHAAGMCSATLIHDENIQLVPSDHALLGISIALGHLSNVFLHNEQDFTNKRPSGSALVQLMRGEVCRIEESIETFLPQMPLVNLAFLHIKILSDKAAETFYSSEAPVTNAAIESINLLRSDQQTASPLEHHFAGLAGITLVLAVELDPVPITDGLNHLRQMIETGRLPPAWRPSINAYISSHLEAHRSKASAAGPNTNRGGLQHLADAAVGADRNTFQEDIDWTTITSKGYLRAFE